MYLKISGDGARFSSTSSFLIISFSLPGTSENVLSSAGIQESDMDTLTFVIVYVLLANHTIAAIRGTENYDLLKSLTDVIDDINDLLKNPVLDDISLKIILGGDYKVFLTHILCTCSYNNN